MRHLLIVIALGTTGCSMPVSDSALCAGLKRPMSELRAGLEAHPETPDAVGEPGTDAVKGFEAGCAR